MIPPLFILPDFRHAKFAYPFMRKKSFIFKTLLVLNRKGETMGKTKQEREFQPKLVKEIEGRFPDAIVISKFDSLRQGFPDLLILDGRNWAALECKKNAKASKQPNQPYYVEKMDGMSFSRFISPENKEEVLNELERSFQARR